MTYLLRGILIGLMLGMPIGAIGALTVQRTWRSGARAGLLTGLGSSVADCFYAGIGAFGITLVSDFLHRWQDVITAIGGIVILGMGVRALLRPPAELPADTAKRGSVRLFLSAFALGLTNPTAIVTFLFAFSYLGIAEVVRWMDGVFLVAGVFLGTYGWWGILVYTAQRLQKKTARFPIRTVHRIFGAILCLFGGLICLRLVL